MKKLFVLFLLFFTTESFATGIGNVSSAPCDNDTLNKYTGTANVEINWEPNTIGLKWFNGDQQIAGQTSCVYDGTITVPPTPTKPGYTFNGWKVLKAIPAEYTELEYIESTGTQYIATGVYQNTSLKIIESYAGVAFSAVPTVRRSIGVFSGASDNYWGVVPNGDNGAVFQNGPNTVSIGTYPISINTKYDIYNKLMNRNLMQVTYTALLKIYLNNTLVDDLWGSTGFDDSELRIFGRSTNAIPNTRIYYYRVLFDGELVLNAVPARRNSDNVIGLYDTVTKQFLTNAGTGAFIAGPVVQ